MWNKRIRVIYNCETDNQNKMSQMAKFLNTEVLI